MRTNIRKLVFPASSDTLCTGFVRSMDLVQREGAFINHLYSKQFHGENLPYIKYPPKVVSCHYYRGIFIGSQAGLKFNFQDSGEFGENLSPSATLMYRKLVEFSD